MEDNKRKILAVVGLELEKPFKEALETSEYTGEVIVRHPQLGRKNINAVRRLARRHSADAVIMEVSNEYDELMLRKVGTKGNVALVNVAGQTSLVRQCLNDGIMTVYAIDQSRQVREAMEIAEIYLDTLKRGG